MSTVLATGTSATNSYTYTVPAGVYVHFGWLHCKYTSSATVGNRQLRLTMLTAADVEICDFHAGAVQAASVLYHYDFVTGIYRETSFVDSSIQVAVPREFVIPAGYKIKISDASNISATDSMTISLQYRDVANRE